MSSFTDAINSFTNTISGPILGNLGTPLGGAAGATASAVSSTAGLLNIVTDLPRVGTIVIGGLFIAAGLFALAGGNKIIQVASKVGA